MPDLTIADSILEMIRRSGTSSIVLDGASWLVWPSERRSGVRAAMSSAQFVHFNAPVVAVQCDEHMEYFDEERRRRWSSNLAWPRANLEMARLPARADVLDENPSEENPSAELPSENDPSGQDSATG